MPPPYPRPAAGEEGERGSKGRGRCLPAPALQAREEGGGFGRRQAAGVEPDPLPLGVLGLAPAALVPVAAGRFPGVFGPAVEPLVSVPFVAADGDPDERVGPP